MRNGFTPQIVHGNVVILCKMVLPPNINFLIKQNKATKINPKILRQQLLFLDMSCLLHKKKEPHNQI